MTHIFLDTVGLIAIWDIDDQWHTAAEGAYGKIISSRQPVMTTTFVLLECGNAAARRAHREDVCVLRQMLELRNEVVIPTEDDWTMAWDAFQQEKIGRAGIVDHISFAVMRRLGIRQAFTNDHHFQEAGFETLF